MPSKNKISIFISTHKRDIFVPDIPVFKQIQVGAANNEQFPNMLQDNTRDNISKKNRSYGETTAMYWAWKNYDSDYYGFFHYRRYMSFSEKKFPVSSKPFIFGEILEENINSKRVLDKYCLNQKKISEIVEQHDFIAATPIESCDGLNVYDQYRHSFGHHIEDLDKALEIIKCEYKEIYPTAVEYMQSKKIYTCNMFIMKRDIFFDYCEFLFDVLAQIEQSREVANYSDIDNRVYGYLAERLTGVYLCYLYKQGYKGKYLQSVYFSNPTPQKQRQNYKHDISDIPKKAASKTKSYIGTNIARAENKAKRLYKNKHLPSADQFCLKKSIDNMNNNLFFDVVLMDAHISRLGMIKIELSVECIRKSENKDMLISPNKELCSNLIVGEIHTLSHSVAQWNKNSDYVCENVAYFFYIKYISDFDFVLIHANEQARLNCSKQQIKSKIAERQSFHRSATQNPDYGLWNKMHSATSKELALQKMTKFNINPLISIVVPLYKTNIEFFKQMVESVLAQTYKNFELVLVNASPENRELLSEINECKNQNDRIRCINLENNLGIVENTNIGIKEATGDFVAFLDHDDFIEPNTLHEYVAAINENEDTDMLYCDEDKVNDGNFIDPYFKPDFNLDLLLGINYVCHFLCCRKSVLSQIELPSKIYDGAQDHYISLMVSDKARHVEHVSKVLYHWRIHEDSTASTPDQKDYAKEAAKLSVQNYLDSKGINAKAVDSLKVPRHYEIEYIIPDPQPKVSIVILSKNCVEILKNCIDSICSRSTYKNYEIVIVDNNSVESDVLAYYDEICKNHTNIRIIKDTGDFNFSRLVNKGIRTSDSDYVILLNNDIEVITDNWIEKMLGAAQRNDVAVVGAKLLFKDDTVQHAGVVITSGGPGHVNYRLDRNDEGYYHTAVLPMGVSCVTGACMLIKKSAYLEVGGFDETFATNYNDVDFCLRICEYGYNILQQNFVELYHFESFSRDKEETTKEGAEKMKHDLGELIKRHSAYFANGDPHFNNNLTERRLYFDIQ